jgi:hypothetical protein
MKTKPYLMFGVVAAVFIGIIVLLAVGRFNWLSALLGTPTTTIITSDTIIDKIEQVSELTTTKYSIQLVVQGHYTDTFLGTGDIHMLLIAKGTVRAGLDMSKLDPTAVTVSADGKSVTVNLPPVKIFDPNHILSSDPNDTYVYHEIHGIGAQTGGMETVVRAEAANQILEAACKDGIMDKATEDAKVVLEDLLKLFVPNVTVISAPVPSLDACKAK